MTDDIQRLLGQIEVKIDVVLENQTDFKTIQKDHAKSIQGLRTRQNIIAGGAASIFGLIMSWKPLSAFIKTITG